MHKNIRLIIQYDGSKYQGWQRLGEHSNKTIQGVLEETLQKMLQEPIQLIGSGRTDAGVHAYAQVANFYISEVNLNKHLYIGEGTIQKQEKIILQNQELIKQEEGLKKETLKLNQQKKNELNQKELGSGQQKKKELSQKELELDQQKKKELSQKELELGQQKKRGLKQQELESNQEEQKISQQGLELNKQQIERYKGFQKRLNKVLPEDIRIIKVEEVSEKFHSRYYASKKTYEYHLSIGEKACVFNRKYTTCIQQTLDIEKMEQAATYFLGTHDFKGFSSEMKDGRKTEKTIYQLSIQKRKEEIIISIQADGFLYNMVRIIVGTLVEIGKGKKSPDSILEIFEKKDRQLAGYTIEAKGLFLKSVEYNCN